MPQPRNIVNLVPLKGEIRQVIATGNNAAWLCGCDAKTVLLGHSCSADFAENDAVECPDCLSRFFVVGDGRRRSRVQEVRQVASKALS